MEYIVKFVAPTNVGDFFVKLVGFLLLCGLLNHIRDVVVHGAFGAGPYLKNLKDASWTALPMCTSALFLIKHLNHLQECLYQQATTDQLTQIPNRRWFMNHCGAELSTDQILVLLDVDLFKMVNDTYGHDSGDMSLVALAKYISESLPESARCARLGGEEFGVLFEGTCMQDCEDLLDHICKGTEIALPGQRTVRITLSAGVFKPADRMNVVKALGFADRALYQSKAAGRARYTLADTAMRVDQQFQGQIFSSALG